MQISRQITKALTEKFAGALGRRFGLAPGGVEVLQNPTEDLIEDMRAGRAFRAYPMAKKVKLVRKEENYLYSTRRFPAHTADNTIGGGAVVAGDYDFFAFGIGDVGSAAGYNSLPALTYLQTNLDKGGRIPTGRGFALYELAVSFSSSAAPGDIAELLDAMALRYEKQGGQLVIQHGPLRFWPSGTGLSGFASTTNATSTIAYATNGIPNMAAVRRFRNPRLLNANDSFRYVVHAESNKPRNNAAIALTDFVEVCIWMYGYHYDRVPQ